MSTCAAVLNILISSNQNFTGGEPREQAKSAYILMLDLINHEGDLLHNTCQLAYARSSIVGTYYRGLFAAALSGETCEDYMMSVFEEKSVRLRSVCLCFLSLKPTEILCASGNHDERRWRRLVVSFKVNDAANLAHSSFYPA